MLFFEPLQLQMKAKQNYRIKSCSLGLFVECILGSIYNCIQSHQLLCTMDLIKTSRKVDGWMPQSSFTSVSSKLNEPLSSWIIQSEMCTYESVQISIKKE